MATVYTMRALHTPSSKYVSWTSIGSPDTSGVLSGYDPLLLSGIVTDYSTTQEFVPFDLSLPDVLGGDLQGHYLEPIVIGLQGNPVSATAPNDDEVLTWTSGAWTPTPAAGGSNITWADDLAGSTDTSQVVARINGATVPAAGSLTTNHVLKVSGAAATTYGYVVDVNVDAAAAIAGTKITPDFGTQNVTASGVTRLGKNATTNSSLYSQTFPRVTNDTIYVCSVTEESVITNFCHNASGTANIGAFNVAAGGTASSGISFYAGGASYTVGAYASNGAIEQVGAATTSLVFGKALGDGSSRGVTGRIWQTGAWNVGDAVNNDTSTEAQAGLTGPLLNVAAASGTATSTANQTLLFNVGGVAFLQGHAGVNLRVNTTDVLSATSTGVSVPDTFSMGPTPATFGEIRLSNNYFIWSRDSGDGSNIPVIGVDGSDVLQVGASGGYPIEISAGNLDSITYRGIEHYFLGTFQFGPLTGGTLDVGGGIGVIGIDDASAVPSANPTDGVILYSEGGVLKYRQPDGTIVTIGNGGGGTPGGNDTEIQFNDGGSFNGDPGLTYNKTTNVLSLTDAIAIGASPAQTGVIRLSHDEAIYGRNAADDGDYRMLLISSDNYLTLGHSGGTSIQTSNTGADFIVGTVVTSIARLSAGANDQISFGASPATTGALRLANAMTINVRNVADDGNLPFLTSTSDSFNIGDATDVSAIEIRANSSFLWGSVNAGIYNKSGSGYALFLDQTSSDSLAFGDIPASGGTIRLSQNSTIYARNGTDDGNLQVFRFDGPSLMEFGDTTIGTELIGNQVFLTSDDVSITSYMRLEAGTLSTIGLVKTFEITSSTDGRISTWNKYLSTVDATITDIHTWTIDDEAVSLVDVSVTAIAIDGSAGASYKRSITFRRTGGTVSTIGSVYDNQTDENSAAWDVTIDNDTSTGRVRVTGDTTLTVRWLATVRVQAILVI